MSKSTIQPKQKQFGTPSFLLFSSFSSIFLFTIAASVVSSSVVEANGCWWGGRCGGPFSRSYSGNYGYNNHYHHRRHRHHRHHRHSPVRSLEILADLFSVTMDGASTNTVRQAQEGGTTNPRSELRTNQRTFYYQVSEDEDGYQLMMEVPGFSSKHLAVDLVNDSELRVYTTNLIEDENDDNNKQERDTDNNNNDKDDEQQIPSFDQTFELDETIDTDRLTVTLSRGLLTIVAPRKIKIVQQIKILEKDDDDEEDRNDDDDDNERKATNTIDFDDDKQNETNDRKRTTTTKIPVNGNKKKYYRE